MVLRLSQRVRTCCAMMASGKRISISRKTAKLKLQGKTRKIPDGIGLEHHSHLAAFGERRFRAGHKKEKAGETNRSRRGSAYGIF